MKTLLAILCLALAGCQVTMPLGENGEYGELYAGYRAPASIGGFNVLNPPTLRDK